MIGHLLLLATTAPGPISSCATLSPADCSDSTCSLLIVQMVEKCSQMGGGEVVLQAGDYAIGDTRSSGGVPLIGLKGVANVILRGEAPGATLQLQGFAPVFHLNTTRNITLSGISITALRYPYTYGQVIRVDPESMVVAFNQSEYPYSGNNEPKELSAAQSLMQFDPVTWRMSSSGIDFYSTSQPIPVRLVGRGQLRVAIGTSRLQSVRTGQWFVLRHVVYGMDGITITNSTNTYFRNMTIWTVPGMGIYASSSRDITLHNIAVRRESGRPMSSTADASHFNGCTGTIILDECYFEGQGDDGINVHGVFHSLHSQSETFPNKAVLSSRPAGGVSPLKPGATYQFRNRSTWAIEGTATLLTASVIPNSTLQYATFAASTFAPSQFALISPVESKSDHSVVIRSSYFGQNRARGALIKTSNVLVENCTFDHPADHCVQAYPDGCYWFESNGFSNWTLVNNTFRGCLSGMSGAGSRSDVFVAACAPDWKDGEPTSSGNPVAVGQPFSNVSIASNVFLQSYAHAAIAFWGIDGLAVENNVVNFISEGVVSHTRDSNTLHGSIDGFTVTPTSARIFGWVVDQKLPVDQPSNISISIDGKHVLMAVANGSRPDLVPVVTPNPYHGFDLSLPPSVVILLQKGTHKIEVFALRANHTKVEIPRSPACVSQWKHRCGFPQNCSCGAPLDPPAFISNSKRCVLHNNSCNHQPWGTIPGCYSEVLNSGKRHKPLSIWRTRASSALHWFFDLYWDTEAKQLVQNENGIVPLPYWNTAEALHMVGLAKKILGDEGDVHSWISALNISMSKKGWTRPFFDDMNWAILAQLASSSSIETAFMIFKEVMKGEENGTCGKGVWWDSRHTQIATASNAGPALSAALLYKALPDNDSLKDFSIRIYAQWNATMTNPVNGAVSDHISVRTANKSCDIVQWGFTYNEGLMLGAATSLAALFQKNNESVAAAAYIADAARFARRIITAYTNVAPIGVLRDDCETDCTCCDCQAFKGVCIRELLHFVNTPGVADVTLSAAVHEVIKTSAEAVWLTGRVNKSAICTFGSSWIHSPTNCTTNAASHTSAIFALLAAADLEN